MDWTRAVDGYCERVGPEYWAEPVNALTNLAFVLVAVWMWPRIAGLLWGRVLCAVLAVIGVGSWLFHTHAQAWAGLADVVPIAVFVLLYIYVANRAYLGLPPLWAGLGAAAFLPFAALTVPVFAQVPGLGSSAAYVPVPLLIALYAMGLRNRLPNVARGLAIGAALLVLSLAARTLDEPLCDALPMGTHFVWHLLNAVMLGWMIAVYRAHMLAGASVRR